jgi:hypothetical protein
MTDNADTSTLIVFEKGDYHLWTRGLAFIASFYLLKKGNDIDDNLLKGIAYSTMFFDAYTFYLSLVKLGYIEKFENFKFGEMDFLKSFNMTDTSDAV